tara:strand:- start:3680 stop:4480 length:801 start_codon:yes stop_codon:yes gene_type:complete
MVHNKTIVVVSGGFDPIHSGHISYLEDSKKLGDKLIVALNSDDWLLEKKGAFFMPFKERSNILKNLNMVDQVIDFKDDEVGSCINALEKVKKKYKNHKIIFANGGDRTQQNIPEMKVKDVDFVFAIGGSQKLNSSSLILKNSKYYKESRIWGKFYNLFQDEKVKVKELIVSPGKGMSYQRHFYRDEVWFVSKGACELKHSKGDPRESKTIKLKSNDLFQVKRGEWHQVINPCKDPCHIIEIQYGEKTKEEDIERLSFYEFNEVKND